MQSSSSTLSKMEVLKMRMKNLQTMHKNLLIDIKKIPHKKISTANRKLPTSIVDKSPSAMPQVDQIVSANASHKTRMDLGQFKNFQNADTTQDNSINMYEMRAHKKANGNENFESANSQMNILPSLPKNILPVNANIVGGMEKNGAIYQNLNKFKEAQRNEYMKK